MTQKNSSIECSVPGVLISKEKDKSLNSSSMTTQINQIAKKSKRMKLSEISKNSFLIELSEMYLGSISKYFRLPV